MFKYLMRKTIYKEADRETQDMLFKLYHPQNIIYSSFIIFCGLLSFLPSLPIFFVHIEPEIAKVSIILLIAIITFTIIILLSSKSSFAWLQYTLTFLLCTTRGKALSNEDFRTILSTDEPILNQLILSGSCNGSCYWTSFKICQILKKGCIEFIAIKKIRHVNDIDDGNPLDMHMIYVNNGWAFDPYNMRQYPMQKIYEVWEAKHYKTISFDEIRGKSYDEFRAENEVELAKWCSINHCTQKFERKFDRYD